LRVPGTSTPEALENAVSSLLEGPGDSRSVDGAKVNALQSIAWRLIGLLAKGQDSAENLAEAVADLVGRAGRVTEITA
jgi:hypothetical protein